MLVQRDPYRALFGASNEMLKGRGLVGWLNTELPAWVEELEKKLAEGKSKTSQSRSEKSTVKAQRAHESDSEVRPKMGLEHGYHSAVASPSDPRWPRRVAMGEETPVKKNNGDSTTDHPVVREASEAKNGHTDNVLHRPRETAKPSTVTKRDGKPILTRSRNPSRSNENDPLTIPPVAENAKQVARCETALDRLAATPRVTPEKDNLKAALGSSAASSTKAETEEAPVPPKSGTVSTDTTPLKPPAPSHRPTILNQLPEDDLDFLTAEAIRTSMGKVRHALPSIGDKQKARDSLETGFKAAHDRYVGLHPMIQAKIMNDQQIRRMKRELNAFSEKKREVASRKPSVVEAEKDTKPVSQVERVDAISRYDEIAMPEPVLSAEDVKSSIKSAQANINGGNKAYQGAALAADARPTAETTSIEGTAEIGKEEPQPSSQDQNSLEQQSSVQSSEEVSPPDTSSSPAPTIPITSAPVPQIFKILTYDPATSEMRLTTTSSSAISPETEPGSSCKRKPAIPLHEALASLENPNKFIPLLTHTIKGIPCLDKYEIISSGPNMLVLREVAVSDLHEAAGDPVQRHRILTSEILGGAKSKNEKGVETSEPSTSKAKDNEPDSNSKPALSASQLASGRTVQVNPRKLSLEESYTPNSPTPRRARQRLDPRFINPIDGTTRLSPTGFAGIDAAHAATEADDVSASAKHKYWHMENEAHESAREERYREKDRQCEEREKERERQRKRTVSGMGVTKTAILAGAACYVAGVVGELMR